MTAYQTVIGLEVHIKLNSSTKLICGCPNDQEFDELAANTHICPVCTGQPGALPVLQMPAFMKGLQLGLALNCEIQQHCYFDRKSYFYPDLPLGYQITQHNRPLNVNGSVPFWDEAYTEYKSARITQAHLETDAGKTTHENGKAYIDYNRAGGPLVEIVTEPDFRSADEAVAFVKEIQRLVRHNNVGNADMEKGQLRCDVNVSIMPVGSDTYGTKVETKNMNSFGAIKRAIDYEVARQTKILDAGGEISQETRGRDDTAGSSYTMRSKENALDYKYFPEPDIPPVQITDEMMTQAQSDLVEAPAVRIRRYKDEYGFNKEFINALINSVTLTTWFEEAVAAGVAPKTAANWLSGELGRYVEGDTDTYLAQSHLSMAGFVDLLLRIHEGSLIDAHAKKTIQLMLETGDAPADIIEREGFVPMDTSEIDSIIDDVISANPQAVADYEAGEQKSIGFLIGQCMQASKGKGNPKDIRTKLIEKLGG